MVFSSLIFLFLFLPMALVCYYAAGRRLRNAVLLAFSWAFYFWGSAEVLGILIVSTLTDYLIGLEIDGAKDRRGAKRWAAFSIIVNLAFLAYFKYANFFVGELSGVLSLFGGGPLPWAEVLLPTGISFFTFHKITYIVDIYRGTKKAFRSFVDFALYIAFFPQLIAGPIVRFHEIADQITGRRENTGDFYTGVVRFLWGLVKKVLIADACGEIADAVFALSPMHLDTKSAWLGVFSYAMQIYFDFSAYADMAVGLGLMFGFKLPENFRRPYSALSITDFWRRWHITLSSWCRDYVYMFALSAGRRPWLAVLASMLILGVWHELSARYLAWGIYHGAGIAVWQGFQKAKLPGIIPSSVATAYGTKRARENPRP